MTPTNTVNTIAELRQVAPNIDSALLVLGYHEPGDGGGGIFRAVPSSSYSAPMENDDGGMIIAPNDSSKGRWKRVYDGPVSVKFFGARALGDNTSDNVAANDETVDVMGTPLTPVPGESSALPTATPTPVADLSEAAAQPPRIFLPLVVQTQ